jgi:hypothetical protein
MNESDLNSIDIKIKKLDKLYLLSAVIPNKFQLDLVDNSISDLLVDLGKKLAILSEF